MVRHCIFAVMVLVISVGALHGTARSEAAAPGTIVTFAGNGTHASSGDGGPATSAGFMSVPGFPGGPEGLAVDSAGDVYIAETFGCRVRRVSGGVITTFAGNGACTFAGDGGPAANASIGELPGVATDSNDNLYIVDLGNCRVRKVTRGIITPMAGTGATDQANNCAERAGDGGPATSADLHLDNPNGIATDAHGNFYVTDSSTCRVREVTGGLIQNVAGNGSCGYGGDGGPATSASMNNPASVAVDAAGDVYIADSVNCRVRKVSAGVITTFAGDGTCAFGGDGGPATSASLSNPFALAVDANGSLYIGADCRVRKVTGGTILTVGGNGTCGYKGDGGPASNANLSSSLFGLAVDGRGNLYIADSGNGVVRMVVSAVLPGTGSGGPGDAGSTALIWASLAAMVAGGLCVMRGRRTRP